MSKQTDWDHVLCIDFDCAVGDGIGRYSDLEFPTKEECTDLPAGWPDHMQPGSLNANILRMPINLDVLGPGYGVQKLDNRRLIPACVIPFDQIRKNLLVPSNDNPERGNAQIWECKVTVAKTSKIFNAWAVRRSGSAYSNVIEIMSDRHLRKAYDLQTGDAVKVRLLAHQL